MISRCDKLQIELNQQSNLLKLKENECALLAKENALGAKCRESLLKKVTSLEGARDELAKEMVKHKTALLTFEKEHELTRKSASKSRKSAEEVARDRDVARKDLKKANGSF